MPVSLKHTLQTRSGILHLQPSGHRISISYSDSGLWITETKHEKQTATGWFLRQDRGKLPTLVQKRELYMCRSEMSGGWNTMAQNEKDTDRCESREGQVRDSGQPWVLLRTKYTKHLIQAMWKGQFDDSHTSKALGKDSLRMKKLYLQND